jgi:WD40 repeat protein
MEQFDAYHKWLGIRPEEQPANHYRLLGIALFESDREVISSAANQRTVYLRQRAAGPQQVLVKKLLDEVAAARNCLLDEKKKSAYDSQLKGDTSAEPPTCRLVTAARPPSNSELDQIAADAMPGVANAVRKFSSSTSGRVAFWITVVVLICVVVFLLSRGSEPQAPPPSIPQGQTLAAADDSDSTTSVDTSPMVEDSDDSAKRALTSTPTPPTKSSADEVATANSKSKSDDSKPIAVAATDSREVQSMLGHRAPVIELAATPDGRFVVSASQGRDRDTGLPFGECLVWDVAAGRLVTKYEGHSGLVRAVAVSPDGRHVVSSGEDIRVWDLETGKDVRELKTSRRPANRVAFGNGGQVATVGARTLIVWDIETGDALQQVTGLSVFTQAVAFSLDGKIIAAGTGEQGEKIGFWNRETGAELTVLSGHRAPVRGLSFLPDGRRMWSFDAAQRALLWDLEAGTSSHQIGPVSAQRVTPDGRFMLFGSEKGIVRAMDSLSARVVGSFPTMPCQIHDLLLLPEAGQIVFAGSGTGPGESEAADFAIHVWTLPPTVKLLPADDPPAPLALVRRSPVENSNSRTSVERKSKRVPPPTGDQLKQAELQVRDIFKTDFAQAKRPEQKGMLASKLIRQADNTRDDPAGRFVLLSEARDLLEAGGSVEAALQVADRLAEAYEVDALSLKLASLKQFGTSLKSTLAMQVAAEISLDMADELVFQESFDTAAELTRVATTLAVKSKLSKLRDDTKARADSVIQKRKLHDEAEQARATLEDSPEDAAAHEKLGRYLCFVRDDWPSGLPHLTKSPTAGLRSAADLESAALSDKDKLVELADAWYDYAKSAKSSDKQLAQARALKWYRDVSETASGLIRVRAQTRVAELSRLIPDAGRSSSPRKASGS